jgi:Protein of unknown function (DUF3365)
MNRKPTRRDSALRRRPRRGSKFAELIIAGCGLLALPGCRPTDAPNPLERPTPAVTFKPQEMADALHAVIAADREVYARYFEQLTGPNGAKPTTVPVHLLREASELVQQKGAEFHYVLRSLWPINPKNAPETPTENEGLKSVLEHPDANYYSEESLGGRRYFVAVYPDRAILPSCVSCHNGQAASPKKDFKPGEVMGGMVVRVPLEF